MQPFASAPSEPIRNTRPSRVAASACIFTAIVRDIRSLLPLFVLKNTVVRLKLQNLYLLPPDVTLDFAVPWLTRRSGLAATPRGKGDSHPRTPCFLPLAA